jgi:hypothetical protein
MGSNDLFAVCGPTGTGVGGVYVGSGARASELLGITGDRVNVGAS